MTIEQYAAEVERLQTAISILIGACFVAIAYIISTPVPEHRPRSKVDPVCPIHKTPRSKCSPESHE